LARIATAVLDYGMALLEAHAANWVAGYAGGASMRPTETEKELESGE
jgi:hypothetical protein